MASIRDAILHPINTAEAVGSAILHADEIAAQIAEDMAVVLREFPEYSASEKGALVGELTVELASLLTSGAGLKAGSRLAKIASESKYGSRVMDAIASGAERAGVAHERVVNNWKKFPERGSIGEKAADVVKKPNSISRYQGPKPDYHVNSAHVKGPNFNSKKTPLPDDAEEVFKRAVPSEPNNPRAWFGKNKDGVIYRFSDANGGTAHFSGMSNAGEGIKNIPDYAKQRLKDL